MAIVGGNYKLFFLTMMAQVFQHRFLAVFYRLALIVFVNFYAADFI